MKINIYLSILFLISSLSTFSQEINKLTNGMNIKKGTIILDDGQKKTFQNMTLEGINLTYYDFQGQKNNCDLSSVYTISKSMNYIRKGAIWGAASGIFLGFAWESINTDDQTFQPLHYLRGSAVIGGVICGAIGAYLGKIRSNEKIYYKNQANFKPVVGFNFQRVPRDLNNNRFPSISIKINF